MTSISVKGPEIRSSMLYHAVIQFLQYCVIRIVRWFLQCFIWLLNINKLQIKAILHARQVQNCMQNCGLDAHRCLSRLFTRPSTCYEAQYVCRLISPLNPNRRVLSGLILLLLIWGLSAIRSSTCLCKCYKSCTLPFTIHMSHTYPSSLQPTIPSIHTHHTYRSIHENSNRQKVSKFFLQYFAQNNDIYTDMVTHKIKQKGILLVKKNPPCRNHTFSL